MTRSIFTKGENNISGDKINLAIYHPEHGRKSKIIE
jgi:hypothetical protein